MALRRTCCNAFRLTEKNSSTWCAASRPQKVPSRSCSSLSAPQKVNQVLPRRPTAWIQQESRSNTATSSSRSPSFFPPRRHFSASPASRHGHLETPKPGEEYVGPLPLPSKRLGTTMLIHFVGVQSPSSTKTTSPTPSPLPTAPTYSTLRKPTTSKWRAHVAAPAPVPPATSLCKTKPTTTR